MTVMRDLSAEPDLGLPAPTLPARAPEPVPVLAPQVLFALTTASIAACTYHGYKRNNSVGWGIWWAAMGLFFPIVAPAIGVAQGFGKRVRR